MRRECEQCGRRYEDITCSTVCPHRGLGYCAVCDCVVCVCSKETSPDWERSNRSKESVDTTV